MPRPRVTQVLHPDYSGGPRFVVAAWITGSTPGADAVKNNRRGRRICSLTSQCNHSIFLTDMETHTPTPAELVTILRGELRLRLVARGERPLVVLIADLFMRLLALVAIRSARAPRQQAPRHDAGAEPGRPEPARIDAPAGFAAPAADAGPDRQAAAAGPDAEPRPAATAAASDTPVIDRETHEDCLHDERGTRTPCARPPRQPRPLVRRKVAATASVAVLHYGSRVVEARFEAAGRIMPISLRLRNNG